MKPTAEICLSYCNLPVCTMVPSVYFGYIVIYDFCGYGKVVIASVMEQVTGGQPESVLFLDYG